MYVPQIVFGNAAGSTNGSKHFAQVKLRVDIVALEGQAATGLRGTELACEVRLGTANPQGNKPEGPKCDFAVRLAAQPGTAGGQGYGLIKALGTPPLIFDLPSGTVGRRLLSRGELRLFVKFWEVAKGGSGVQRGRLFGELVCGVPVRSSVPRPLVDGLAGLSLRVDAHWDPLDEGGFMSIADHLGRFILEASVRQRWQDLGNLTSLASARGDWGKAPPDTIRALTVGKVNKDERTALRLCIVQASDPSGAASAAKALLDARSDPRALAADGASPLTMALQAGAPFAPMLVQCTCGVSPDVAKAVGLAMVPPWLLGPVNWDALRSARAFDLIIQAAENSNLRRAHNGDSMRSAALGDSLCHAVNRRFPAMSSRAIAAMPPLNGQASASEALLLEKMLRMASTDDRWFGVAEAQLRRGAELGTKAWRGGQRVLLTLADLAAKGQSHAQEMLLEAALGKGYKNCCHEPRLLFPERAAECAVCFEPLYQNSPAFFLDEHNKRPCLHYVCAGCAVTCLPSKECPMCRAPIVNSVVLPPLEADPRGWFKAAACGDGTLEPGQLCHAVAASIPVSEENLLYAIEDESGPFKRYWDKNADGKITEDEFFDPEKGLFSWILAHLQELHRAEKRTTSSVPDMRQDPAAWFDFWDDQGAGSLAFGEVLRGVFSSRRLSALDDRQRLTGVRSEVSNIWRSVGLQAESVSKAEFLRRGGLASQLAASLEQAGVPPGEVSIAALPPSPAFQAAQPLPVVPSFNLDGLSEGAPASESIAPGAFGHALLAGTLGLGAKSPGGGYGIAPAVQSRSGPPLQSRGNGRAPVPTSPQSEAMSTLLAMGFLEADISSALSRTNGDVERAANMLLGNVDR